MRTEQVWFECVQVVTRNPEGKLTSWYDGEQRATEQEATKDMRTNSKLYFDVEYVVVRKTLQER